MGYASRARDWQPSQENRKKQDENGAEREVGERQAEQADYAEQAVIPSVAPLRRAHSGRNREQHRNQKGRQSQLQGVRIALRDQVGYALVESQGRPQIAAQNAFPIVQILPAERKVEPVGVTGGLYVGYRSAFSKHLQDGIAGDQVDQQEHQRDDQPDDRQCVENT